MSSRTHFNVLLICIVLMMVFRADAIPCDSCGRECASACGTKHFRTCCFNYLRKRSDPNELTTMRNKRLIDVLMLQGHAVYSSDDLSREHKDHLLRDAVLAAAAASAVAAASSRSHMSTREPPLYYENIV